MTLKESNEKKKKQKTKYVSSDNDTDEEDVDQLEALLARIFHRGKGKFKGKLPIMCFNCNEVGHIAARFQRRRTTKVVKRTKVEEMKTTKITKTKARSLATLLKKKLKMDLTIMMMKWYLLQ